MPTGLSKVRCGDPLVIPATAYNAFVDAALDHQKRRVSTSADALRDKDPANIVLVKNESGAARSRFDILGITGPIITRADNAATFQSRIALRGVTPNAAHAGRFVVLVDAIPHGTIGRAYVAGACLARVRMLDETHTAADVDDGQAGRLASGASGSAALLWVEPVGERADPAVAWAVIRFGGGAGSSGTAIDLDEHFILALLKSVQRFNADTPDLPAYHWKQAQIRTDGTAEEKPGGLGSKTVPSCDVRTVDDEDVTFAVLADPAAAGNNLTDAVLAADGTLTLRLSIAPDTTHTVTGYRILVGTSFTDVSYGSTGLGATLTLLLTGIPLETNLYVRVRTVTSDAGSRINRYILQMGLNGVSAPQVAIAGATAAGQSATAVTLITPVSGDYHGTIVDDWTDLAIGWQAVAGASHYLVTVGSGIGNWYDGEANTYDLYDPGTDATATAHLILNVPVDGVTRYLYLGWRTDPSYAWQFRCWAMTLSPLLDRRAINVEDINHILTESQVGLAGLTEMPDPPTEGEEPDIVELETELAVPILVQIWRTTDAAGLDRFVFEHVEQEFIAEILAESAEGEDDDYSDARYWVKMLKVANADPDNAAGAPLALGDAAHAAARVITAENLAETAKASHLLRAGMRVMVRTVRGGDKPWITRYTFNCGGDAGGARFLAKVQSQGPNAEADYTDARYWVQEVDDTTEPADEFGYLTLATVPVANGGRWVTAHNIGELGVGPSDRGGHFVRKAVTGIVVPDRYVLVRAVAFTTGTKYLLESYPGQIQEGIYGAMATCLDANGCITPVWYKMTGPAFDQRVNPPSCPS